MTTVTSQLRQELINRLLALDETTASNIGKVLNPDEARDPKNRPAAGKRFAILWTMDGRMKNQRAGKLQWSQGFAVDVAVEWQGKQTEDVLDKMRLEIASAFAQPISGLFIQEQTLQDITIGYPSEGSRYAVVSVVADYTYIETLT